jgi:hypothetical protein
LSAELPSRSADIMRWPQQSGFQCDEHTSYKAARTAHNLEVLQFLHDSGCPAKKYVCNAAVAAGDLEQLQWLCAHGASLDTVGPTEVCQGATFPIVCWLRQQGALRGIISEAAMAIAAGAGDTDFCRWLRSQRCRWDAHATTAAARSGHCDTLRFLHEGGCPRDMHSLLEALLLTPGACAEPLPVLQCLAEQGAFSGTRLLNWLLNWAGSWLRQQGAEWPDELYTRDRDNEHRGAPWCDKMVAWARAEGCTAPAAAVPDHVSASIHAPHIYHMYISYTEHLQVCYSILHASTKYMSI